MATFAMSVEISISVKECINIGESTFITLCTVARFLTWQNWNFKNPINFLCVILCPNQDLEKAFYSNIAPSIRTESHFLDLLRATCRKSIVVHIF